MQDCKLCTWMLQANVFWNQRIIRKTEVCWHKNSPVANWSENALKQVTLHGMASAKAAADIVMCHEHWLLNWASILAHCKFLSFSHSYLWLCTWQMSSTKLNYLNSKEDPFYLLMIVGQETFTGIILKDAKWYKNQAFQGLKSVPAAEQCWRCSAPWALLSKSPAGGSGSKRKKC